MIQKKRIYDTPAPDDGYRVLVDRLWPRGLRRETAQLDAWTKALAPSPALRHWYGHEPDKWLEFQERYEQELRAPEAQAALAELRERGQKGTVTLLYAAKDGAISNAAVLERLLRHGSEPS